MATLDMSLDDMIKSRKSNEKGGRGQSRPRRGRGPGGSFRGGRPFGAPRRNPLGSIRRTKSLPWQNGLFEDSLKAAGLSGLDAGTKLYISNLDVGVSNEDIRVLILSCAALIFYSSLQWVSFGNLLKRLATQELFAEIGELIRYAIHFDKNGRPSGSAEVIFARRSDAFQAFKRYNNVQLDGKPMKIEIIGANAEVPISARVNVVGGANGKKRTVVMTSGPGRSRGGFTGANRGSVLPSWENMGLMFEKEKLKSKSFDETMDKVGVSGADRPTRPQLEGERGLA
ncbi:hypothetical protein DH2020_048238 [Rehmannia glutinosa]|uniref:RRM domain-containing protein n=1 Tax=Rehmannia glutinosa TaxID=99300 RepID=A0ABR0U6F0_REHGL